jgi:hypothetical protein
MIATVDQILAAAAKLPAAERVQIIRGLTATLDDRKVAAAPEFLPYGKYRDGPESSEEDFLIAEWRPAEADWNGE